jgi:hypothetical protein
LATTVLADRGPIERSRPHLTLTVEFWLGIAERVIIVTMHSEYVLTGLSLCDYDLPEAMDVGEAVSRSLEVSIPKDI